MPTTVPRVSSPCLRVCAAVVACLPLPAMASDFTGMLTGLTLMLLGLVLLLVAPLLLVRRHAWARWLGTGLGGLAMLVAVGTFCVDTWRVLARMRADTAIPQLMYVALYIALWLAIGYVIARLRRRPPPGAN
ncbi:hypothetical protein [Stenotrophomonas sp. NPDC077461]|uniref:hypothetical protein n=1 Tax=Stenotrophomonas sp. NPDC077461 TaxID=3414698 RepID=UPI003C2AF8FA